MISFRIVKLDIFQSYFFGSVRREDDTYRINIQSLRRGKVLKLPCGIVPARSRVVVRLTGPGDVFVEDILPYSGESEWVEIDSDEITYFVANRQDQFDTLEIVDD